MKTNQQKALQNGKFVISLDFELLWGVRDKRTIESYGDSITAVKEIIPRLLNLFEKYNINATFSIVGFLFAENKKELLSFCPSKKPNYTNTNLSPYNGHFDILKEDALDDPYHYAPELIHQIKSYQNHAIGTHTFSHYYCMEPGQNSDEFKSDIEAAISIAKKNDIDTKSIIFPRNQCNDEYLAVCENLGIQSYRGNEIFWLYKFIDEKLNFLPINLKRYVKILDAYANISGHHCYKYINRDEKHNIYNIPSSRLLRPYSNKLSFLESLKLRRIKKSMTYAAKNNKLYHLWWHPHNFGTNIDENFKNLEIILAHYKILSKKYGFTAESMEQITDQISQA